MIDVIKNHTIRYMKIKNRILLVVAIMLLFTSCYAEMDAATATTFVGKITIIFEFIMALLPVLGGLACIVSGIYFIYEGLAGDIQLIVEGSSLSMKLLNASPGIVLVALGVIILWKKRFKVKITNSES